MEGTNVLAALPLPVPQGPTAIIDGTSNTIILAQPNSLSVTLARPPGPHTFFARYSGDAMHQAGTSAPITITFL